jgi:hypothetical protein
MKISANEFCSRCWFVIALLVSLSACLASDDGMKDPSIWDSYPIEIDNANIQILDKISGKVFRQTIKVNKQITFGNIQLTLKRCFKNSPEDSKEIYAYIEIHENGAMIFSKWLFASSPSINLFSHPIYDVRTEF